MSKTVTALVVSEKALEGCVALDKVAQACSQALGRATGVFERMGVLSWAVTTLRSQIAPEQMKAVMSLQGTRLGFLTDKDSKGGYDEATVKECLIEAILRGVYPVMNEFNIIASNMYITKEGFGRLIREFPGLTDYKESFGVPRIKDGGAEVACQATWLLNGQPGNLERTIPVGGDLKYMKADATIGKATRKLRAAVHTRLTGSEQSDGEVSETAKIIDVPHKLIAPTDEPTGFAGARPAGDSAEPEAPPPSDGDASPPDMETERELLLIQLRDLAKNRPEKFAGVLSSNDMVASEIKGMNVTELNDLVEAIQTAK